MSSIDVLINGSFLDGLNVGLQTFHEIVLHVGDDSRVRNILRLAMIMYANIYDLCSMS